MGKKSRERTLAFLLILIAAAVLFGASSGMLSLTGFTPAYPIHAHFREGEEVVYESLGVVWWANYGEPEWQMLYDLVYEKESKLSTPRKLSILL